MAFALASRRAASAGLVRRAAPTATSRRALIVRAAEKEAAPAAATEAAPVSAEPTPVAAAAPAPAMAVAAATTGVSVYDAMKFTYADGPEIINGRLAMLAIFAAIGAELATGESVFEQFAGAQGVVLATVGIISAASLVPLVKGADPAAAFGPLTRSAERLNGQAAMLGLAALLVIELTKGSALF